MKDLIPLQNNAKNKSTNDGQTGMVRTDAKDLAAAVRYLASHIVSEMDYLGLDTANPVHIAEFIAGCRIHERLITIIIEELDDE